MDEVIVERAGAADAVVAVTFDRSGGGGGDCRGCETWGDLVQTIHSALELDGRAGDYEVLCDGDVAERAQALPVAPPARVELRVHPSVFAQQRLAARGLRTAEALCDALTVAVEDDDMDTLALLARAGAVEGHDFCEVLQQQPTPIPACLQLLKHGMRIGCEGICDQTPLRRAVGLMMAAGEREAAGGTRTRGDVDSVEALQHLIIAVVDGLARSDWLFGDDVTDALALLINDAPLCALDGAAAALLAAGADANVKLRGSRQPVLTRAAARAAAPLCARLLAAGAAVDAPDADGYTALTWAAVRGAADVCRVLAAAGADPDHADLLGQTPYSLARRLGDAAVCEVLEGARRGAG